LNDETVQELLRLVVSEIERIVKSIQVSSSAVEPLSIFRGDRSRPRPAHSTDTNETEAAANSSDDRVRLPHHKE